MALTTGVGAYILPIVTVTVVPELSPLSSHITLKVDLDAADFSLSTGVVPGRVLIIGEDVSALERLGWEVVTTEQTSLVFQTSGLVQIATTALEQQAGSDLILLPGSLSVTRGEPALSASGRVMSLPVAAQVQARRPIPVAAWRKTVLGMPTEEARDWLASQPGVVEVLLVYTPHFFAKVSQKLPTNPFALRFRLDTGGKTSILE